jgi:hypothetical protein
MKLNSRVGPCLERLTSDKNSSLLEVFVISKRFSLENLSVKSIVGEQG